MLPRDYNAKSHWETFYFVHSLIKFCGKLSYANLQSQELGNFFVMIQMVSALDFGGI